MPLSTLKGVPSTGLRACRSIVSPWECDTTEHFTIAYYFDRLSDASAALADSLGWYDTPRISRRFDVRFVRELRAGAAFHILSGPIALDTGFARLGHQIVKSANGEVNAWAEETVDTGTTSLPGEISAAIGRRLMAWPGPAVEHRPEPATTQEFIATVQQRGAAVIKARGLSSAGSAANAIIDTVFSLTNDTPGNDWHSVAVCSDGRYDVEQGLISSFPVRVRGGKWEIVEGVSINDFSRSKIDASVAELKEEKSLVAELLGK